MPDEDELLQDDTQVIEPRAHSLADYKRLCGTRTGTFTFNGVTYTDLNEVIWRQAHDEWPRG